MSLTAPLNELPTADAKDESRTPEKLYFLKYGALPVPTITPSETT